MYRIPIIILALCSIAACKTPTNTSQQEAKQSMTKENSWDNPAATGFNSQESDASAIALADSVMYAMGGRQAWDECRFFHWNFFGRRSLLWDKYTGRVRIEVPGNERIYLINVQDETGQIWQAGQAMTHPDSLAKYINRGKSIWINDSYWLVMPFKLKDSGVTLKDMGMADAVDGQPARVLQLTFQDVGKTPENKYLVYIDPNTKLVKQWDYFEKASDTKPWFNLPWQNYQQYGPIKLSGDRGKRQLTDIAVYREVPDAAFNNSDPIDRSTWASY